MSNPRLIALIVASASFIQQIDGTIVATSLPQIAESLHANPIQLGIAISAYSLSLAVFMPISGWMADRFGASAVFRAAIGVFTLGSILCGLSGSVVEMTAARLLQGAGGAMMSPIGRLLVLRAVDKSSFIGTMAWLQLPGQLGPVIGLPLGGFITTYASWRWNFFINIPIGLLGIVMAAIYIRNEPAEDRRPLDWVGFLLSGVALAGLVYALNLFGRPAAELAHGGLMLGASALVGLVAILHALRHPHPLLNLSLLRIPTFSVNFFAGSLFRYGADSTPFLLPLLFQLGFGMTAFDAGLLAIASALGSITMRPLAKPILRRIGYRSLLIGNGLVSAASIALCALYTESTSAVVVFVTLTIGGFFRALQLTGLNTIAYVDVPARQMSSATGFAGMIQQLSNALGVAIAVIVLHVELALMGSAAPSATEFRLAFVVMAGISLLSMPFFFALPRNAGADFSGHEAKKT